jgi:hypothetical protein
LFVHAESDSAATAASAARPVLRIMEGRTSC